MPVNSGLLALPDAVLVASTPTRGNSSEGSADQAMFDVVPTSVGLTRTVADGSSLAAGLCDAPRPRGANQIPQGAGPGSSPDASGDFLNDGNPVRKPRKRRRGSRGRHRRAA